MLTYTLKKYPHVPLYEALYREIREDILSGALAPGEKLPSRRALAQNLEVSNITVDQAYGLLLAEGYIRSEQRRGYFVEASERPVPPPPPVSAPPEPEENWLLDLAGGGTQGFPFSVWAKLQREVTLDYGERLLLPLPSQGLPELRRAIAGHLAAFRGMCVDPENILVGAGTDFLYNLLPQLLGREKTYAVEEPGYSKVRGIYAACGANVISAPMDGQGVLPEVLERAEVLHFSPSHHFPTGLITPLPRRQALLEALRGYLVEDDYDSEFRYAAHPLPAMQALDPERVIYMNTFSKSLAPSIRIGYLVLPPALAEKYRRELRFYGCTVSSLEQHTLARFLGRGYFEKHINRMRRAYRGKRDALLAALEGSAFAPRLSIREEDAGLHFLLRVDTGKTDRELVALAAQAGIRIRALSEYYHDTPGESTGAGGADRHTLVVNYAALRPENLPEAVRRLEGLGK